MGFAFASVGFHLGSLLTFKGGQTVFQWHWHLAKTR